MDKYYSAEIEVINETYENNDKSEGIDPDSWTEQGIETIRHHSLAGLFEKVRAFTGSHIEKDEGADETNRYISQNDSWHWIPRDNWEKEKHILVTFNIWIYKIEKTPLDI